MEKKEKNTRKRSLIIDIVLLAIMLIVSVISFYIAYTFGLIPMKWITIFAVVVGCSFLILLLLNFKKLPTWGLVMKRFVLIVLTVCIGTCGYFLDKSRTTINKISKTTVNEDGSTTKKSKMFVVVKKDADIDSIHSRMGEFVIDIVGRCIWNKAISWKGHHINMICSRIDD